MKTSYFFWLLCLLFLLAIVLGTMQATTTDTIPIYSPTVQTPPKPITPDPRIANLTRFFERYHASTAYINDYLNAADQNHIDYRLLPAISAIESGAGQHACGNNWWGWQSCKGRTFVSVAEGIQFVSQQLANGNYYRGKSIDKKLRAYNPNAQYAPRVKQFMREIAPNQ